MCSACVRRCRLPWWSCCGGEDLGGRRRVLMWDGSGDGCGASCSVHPLVSCCSSHPGSSHGHLLKRLKEDQVVTRSGGGAEISTGLVSAFSRCFLFYVRGHFLTVVSTRLKASVSRGVSCYQDREIIVCWLPPP